MLLMHTHDGREEGLEEVTAVPVPLKTKTYQPVANGDLIRLVKRQIRDTLGLSLRSEKYGLSKGDQNMFGVLTLDTGDSSSGLAIGLRNSYDKSLTVGFAAGASVFVCDNLCFSASGLVIVRKHTVFVWRDIQEKIREALAGSSRAFEHMSHELTAMRAKPVTQDTGYDMLGRALGHGVLRLQQASIALRDWKTPRHEEFGDRNLYSLYNCFTEGLKKGPAGEAMARHARAHDWVVRNFAIPAPPVTFPAS